MAVVRRSRRLSCVLCVLAGLAGLALFPATAAAQGARVGGPCRYDDFPGTAVIASVAPWRPASPAEGSPTPYPPLAVTFVFTPSAPIVGEPLYRPDAVHGLTLVNGMPPGPRFIAKYGIAPGKAFPCRLRLIREGTCTPALFDFPGIDRTDYFELTRP